VLFSFFLVLSSVPQAIDVGISLDRLGNCANFLVHKNCLKYSSHKRGDFVLLRSDFEECVKHHLFCVICITFILVVLLTVVPALAVSIPQCPAS
jgi:hypothetical protein